MSRLNFELGASYTFTKTIAECDVYQFAGITGDYFPAHVNAIYCKMRPYKHRIVHGCLTFGLASTVSGRAAEASGHDMVAVGYDALRFVKPVFFGDTITAEYVITELDEKKLRTTAQCTMRNQHGEKVLTCVHYMQVI